MVEGNYIGTNPHGTGGPERLRRDHRGRGRGQHDRRVTPNAGTGAGNVISGNTADGCALGTPHADHTVEGDDVGASPAGTTALGNGGSGVAHNRPATNNTISGEVGSGNVYGISPCTASTRTATRSPSNPIASIAPRATTSPLPNGVGVLAPTRDQQHRRRQPPAAANVISGNSGGGINIGNTGTSGNVVANNYIGTDSASDTGLGNVSNGVLFFGDANGGPTNNTIGPGNVISGNSSVGVALYNPGTSGNVVAGMFIGTNTQGTGRAPEREWRDHRRRRLGQHDRGSDRWGGQRHRRQRRRWSRLRRPERRPDSSQDDAILGNSIYGNSGLGIDLGHDGCYKIPNDSSAHTGPNLFQDFPVLSSATDADGATAIAGSLLGSPNTTYRIEFFSNPTADPSGYGQGETYLTIANVTTNSSGTVSFWSKHPTSYRPDYSFPRQPPTLPATRPSSRPTSS